MKLITVLHSDWSLLPQFLHHYAAQGVTEFLIGAYRETGAFDAAPHILAAYPHLLFPISGSFSASADIGLCHELCNRFIGADEWWAITDLDEFHEYPVPLGDLCPQLEQRGYRYLMAQLLDRITSDGSCPGLLAGEPLWEQFPAAAYITRDLMGTIPTKVLLVRGARKLLAGHHRPGECIAKEIYVGGVVHHFKWYGDIVSKMEARRASILARRAPRPDKCDIVINFWKEHGRLPVTGEYGFHFPIKPLDWPAFTPTESPIVSAQEPTY
jgi:hypothetical protein